MQSIVTLSGIAYATPDGRRLFDGLDLSLSNEITGLVGRNGAGKSSLIRIIAGALPPVAGSVSLRGRVGLLAQAPTPGQGGSIAGLIGVAAALERLRRAEAGEADEDDLALADWTLEARLAEALVEVELPGLDLARPAASLSGGEATRAALAGLLAAEPDLMLLDEPTNNLDARARHIVGEVLGRWPGGALVASHDRTLLRGVDRIVELTSLGARLYGGGYDLYAARKAEALAAAERDLEVADRKAGRTEREVQTARERKARRDGAGHREALRGGAPKILLGAMAERAENSAGRASNLAARQRDAAAEQLEAARARVEFVRRLAFALPSSGLPAGKAVLRCEAASFAYPGRPPVLADFTLRMTGPERVAIGGPNGSGKTTLLRLITGALRPTKGEVTLSVRATMLDQRTAILRDGETVLENFRRLNPELDDNACRAALARFLFRADAALKPTAALSGGERLRAALACVLVAAQPPQLLILDEPTNHLDLDSIEAVEAALRGYDGALLVVSHDADFLAAVGVERRIELRRAC